jgi:alkylation response protein AidB-like acyl-CoA dehydrogenase
MELKFRGNLLFVLQMVQFLQEQDNEKDLNKDLFRISTSALKVFTAKEAVTLISEGLECFGGLGYMENSKIPVIYRDAQVLTIWEGTTNVLSLDFVKTVAKDAKRFSEIFTNFTS